MFRFNGYGPATKRITEPATRNKRVARVTRG